MNETIPKLLLIAVAIAGLAALAWIYRDVFLPAVDAPVDSMPVEPEPDDSVTLGPIHPLPPGEADRTGDRQLVDLPALDDSDGYFRLAMTDLFGGDLSHLIVNEGLIDKIVASIDNLPRSHVAEKIRPLGQLQGAFVASIDEDDDRSTLGGENYARYDALVSVLTAADSESIVATYRRFYPLFQESYERLGYPNAYFNDRLVEVIDHLLATPETSEPIALARPNVLYEFADPDLEALSAGQKLLLRMGPGNAAKVKTLLLQIRQRVA